MSGSVSNDWWCHESSGTTSTPRAPARRASSAHSTPARVRTPGARARALDRAQLGERVGRARAGGAVGGAADAPELVVARHEEHLAEPRAQIAQRVLEPRDRLAQVARDDQRVVLVRGAAERLDPRPILARVHVHVAHRPHAPALARARDRVGGRRAGGRRRWRWRNIGGEGAHVSDAAGARRPWSLPSSSFEGANSGRAGFRARHKMEESTRLLREPARGRPWRVLAAALAACFVIAARARASSWRATTTLRAEVPATDDATDDDAADRAQTLADLSGASGERVRCSIPSALCSNAVCTLNSDKLTASCGCL